MRRRSYRRRRAADWTRGACGKRAYGSAAKAREANRHASWRIRVYRCRECRAWHASNADKRSPERSQEAR